MRRRTIAAAMALVGICLPGTAWAGVDTDNSAVTGTGSATPDGHVQVELTGNGSGGGRGSGSRSGSSGAWVGYDVGVCGPDGEVWLNVSVSSGGLPGEAPFEPVGVVRHLVLLRPDGSTAGVFLWNQCDGGPPPTAPPSAAEVLAAADLPLATVMTSPRNQGLVGFPNWFWYEGPAEVPVTASLGGWTGTATARAVRWSWSFGDGNSATASVPGTAEDPAVTHTYITKGTRDIVLTVTWEASFTLTGWGTTVSTGLGSVELGGEPLSYLVQEREAVVVG